jgi:hypothetical protein
MDDARPVGADRREEVLRLDAVDYILQLLAVAGEEDGAGAGTISATNNVALYYRGAVGCWVEGLVESPAAVGLVPDRVLVEA